MHLSMCMYMYMHEHVEVVLAHRQIEKKELMGSQICKKQLLDL